MALAQGVLVHRVPEEPYEIHIDDLLRESQDIVRLAQSIDSLNQMHSYSEALTLTRSLLEKSFHFYLSTAGTKTISYAVLEDEAHMHSLAENEGISCELHTCANQRGGVCVVVIEDFAGESDPYLPGLRYARLESRAALTHSFPAGFRRLLWSYVPEDELRRDFNFWRSHYLDWNAHLEEAIFQGLIDKNQKALLQSHYGYLSAIAHSPRSLISELHGRNRTPKSPNVLTQRLILLYIHSLLGLVFVPLSSWAKTIGYWDQEFIAEVDEALAHLEVVRSELHFPFSSLHDFDIWQSENVRIANIERSMNFRDLNRDYLTDNFLERLRSLHRPQFEFSTRQHWTPRNFL